MENLISSTRYCMQAIWEEIKDILVYGLTVKA